MGARVSATARLISDEPQDHATIRELDVPPVNREAPSHGLWVVRYEDDPPGRLADHSTADRQDEARRQQRDASLLSEVIKQRIRARTSERIRELEVLCEEGRIVIRGRCATFYTKQLAQHAAMGVVEDETLINEVAVGLQ